MATPRSRRSGRRWLIWIVAAASTAEALLASIQGIVDQRPDPFALWFVGAAIIALIATVREKYEDAKGGIRT